MDPTSTDVMFSSKSDEWTTPRSLFDALHAEFKFDIDGAATEENALCAFYYGLDQGPRCLGDALCGPWAIRSHVFLNPPYSRCAEFVGKASRERRENQVTSVILVPSRTDTKWFHQHVWDQHSHHPYPGIDIRFIKGRLKFGDSRNSAPFPSLVIIMRP